MIENEQDYLRQSFLSAVSQGKAWGAEYYRAWGKERNLPDNLLQLEAIPAEELRQWIIDAKNSEVVDDSNGQKGSSIQINERGVHVIGPLKITGTVFDLSAVQFNLPIRLIGCAFEGDIRIDDAELKRLVLSRCNFRSLFGENSILRSNLEIKSCKVLQRVWLIRTQIGGHLNLEGTEINQDDNLSKEFFIGQREVTDDKNRVLRCEGGSIRGGVLLRNGFNAVGCITVRRAEIRGVLRARGGSFTLCREDFKKSHNKIKKGYSPIAVLDLRGTTIGGTLDLTSVEKFNGALDLRDARARAFADDGTAWPAPGYLMLDGFTYDRFTDSRENVETLRSAKDRKEWLCLQRRKDNREEFKPQPWTQVATVLSNMGHDNAAREVLYAREKKRRRYSGRKQFAKSPFLWLYGFLTGYGYLLHRSLIAVAVLLMVNVMTFMGAKSLSLVTPAQEEVILDISHQFQDQCFDAREMHEALPTMYPEYNSWVYALDVIVPVVEFRQTSYWEISSVKKCHAQKLESYFSQRIGEEWGEAVADFLLWSNFFRLVQWVSIVLGWLLTFILIAGLSSLLEKERR